MRTFTQLIERFVTSTETALGYAEIFINPSKSELMKIGKPQGKDSGEYEPALQKFASQGFVPPFKFYGAYVSDRDWYVWDRHSAFHQSIAQHLQKELKVAKFYPVYAYYFISSNALFIQPASFAASLEMQIEMQRGVLKTIALNHPQFKQFGTTMVF